MNCWPLETVVLNKIVSQLNLVLCFVSSFFLEEIHGPSAVTQENVSQREEPELNALCCNACKRPYEQSTNEDHIAKRVKHEVYSAPTVSEDKFSYMGKLFCYSCNSFESIALFHN